MEPTFANRVARRHLHAWSSSDGLIVNIWDDSPPHAPILIEGEWPAGLDKAGFIDFLAGYMMSRGWEIKPKDSWRWEGASAPRQFEVKHPDYHSKDDWPHTAETEREHNEFLNRIRTALEQIGEYAGHKVVVISES
jgi:hypothetical protein